MRANPLNRQVGITLVETIVSLVILSIAFVSIASVLTGSVSNSATPMVREQAVSLAESYLEMILLHPYLDPTEADSGTCEEGSLDTDRALYDDTNDFNCISDTNGARDQLGVLIPGLGGYNIDVNMLDTTLNGATAKEIDVVVTHDGLSSLTVLLRGYRVVAP